MITPSFSLTATERVLPKLALDFTTANLDSRITFTRTTSASNPATYVNSNGYIAFAANDAPRFDYDPVTLACKGLLIEESRTNSFTYSEDFSATGWATTRASIGTDQTTAPDNAATADKLIEDTSTNTHFMTRSSFSFTSGNSYSLSIYLKAAGRSRLRITSGNTTTWSAGATFNLATGTIVSTAFGTAQIQNSGNGWYRCTISGAAGATAATSVNFVLSNGTSESYTGDGVSGVYVWGAQMEVGAFPTSYIPTTTTALTRNADVATMTGTNFSSWWNATEGALQFKFAMVGVYSTSSQRLIQMDDGSSANRIGTFLTSSNTIQQTTTIAVGNAGTFSPAGPTVTPNATVNYAFAYKLNNCISSGDAQIGTADTLVDIPTVNILRIAAREVGIVSSNLWVKELNYWPQRLIDNEVQAFSK